jgi:hypothetical protein
MASKRGNDMRIAASCLQSIKLIWGNLHVVGQLFGYGIFGVVIGLIAGALEVVVDTLGSIVGFVLMIPVAIVELILRLIFGKF